MFSGRGFRIEVDVSPDGSKSYQTLGQLTESTRLRLESRLYDDTDNDAGGWHEGARSTRGVSVSGRGAYRPTAASAVVLSDLISETHARFYRVTTASGEQFEGCLQVTTFDFTGHHDDDEAFEFVAQSTGPVNYTRV